MKRLIPLLFCACVAADGQYGFDSDPGGTEVEHEPFEQFDFPIREIERGFKLDLPESIGCTQLDLLFVVDNSGSMLMEQEALLEAVPGFVEHMRSFGVGFDLHVGVTPTDPYQWNPPECRDIGALVRQTDLETCTPYVDGEGYMVREELFDDTFPCAFSVGVNGSGYERQLEATVEALKPPLMDAVDPWGYRLDNCNVGFHRPEAGLVIVILTDESDGSAGTATQWAERLLFVHPGELLVVAFIPHPSCPSIATNSVLPDFLLQVPSYTAPICSDYALEFERATREIVAECGAVPPTP